MNYKMCFKILTKKELQKHTKKELLAKCEELNIAKCKSKSKKELIEFIFAKINQEQEPKPEEPKQNQEEEPKQNQEEEPKQEQVGEQKEEQENNRLQKYTLVDLCCGTGAFSLAFHQTNKVKTIFANDILESAKKIFDANNQITMTQCNLFDIPNENIPKTDILCAGFPCQGFSVAGLRKGFDDERSNVFWKILSIIATNKPKIVILENVKNLQSHDNGKTFTTIIDHLITLQYYIKHSILNTKDITGIPQNRERIYIVCFADKSMCDKFDFNFAKIKTKPISAFLEAEENVEEKYYYTNKTPIYDTLLQNITKRDTIYQYRRFYVRENKNNVCPTLTANMGSGGHNVPILLCDKGIRKLTPRECFYLQGFPKDFILPQISTSKLYSLAGNAVSVPVVELIANKIMENCFV